MGLFSSSKPTTVVQGRAFVVPTSTGNLGNSVDGNHNNLGHRSRVRSVTVLVMSWVADGGPMPSEQQKLTLSLSNWLRIVMYTAGTNDPLAARLPAEIHVPVWVDCATRRIESVDTDVAEAELEPYREAAREWWKDTEAPLADARQLIALPKNASRFVKDLTKGWREGVSEFVQDLSQSGPSTPKDPSPEEFEELRRNAVILRYNLESNPRQFERHRNSALQAAPSIAEMTKAGTYGVGNFNLWMMLQTVSGVITADEAASYRAAAGLLPEPPVT